MILSTHLVAAVMMNRLAARGVALDTLAPRREPAFAPGGPA